MSDELLPHPDRMVNDVSALPKDIFETIVEWVKIAEKNGQHLYGIFDVELCPMMAITLVDAVDDNGIKPWIVLTVGSMCSSCEGEHAHIHVNTYMVDPDSHLDPMIHALTQIRDAVESGRRMKGGTWVDGEKETGETGETGTET